MEGRRDQQVILQAREELSATCFALQLACSARLAAQPGQFAMLGLVGSYDPLLRRPFSLAGLEQEGEGSKVELLVKEVGKVTSLLRKLPLASPLWLLAPLGKGFQLEAAGPYPALVAGGIGLPPLLFAARRLARQGVRFDFYFGASTAGELIARQQVAKVTTGEVFLCTDDGSAGEKGLVTQALEKRLDRGYSRILACGPSPMLRAVARLARQHQVEAELSLEEPMACGLGVCLGCVVKRADRSYVPTCTAGPVFLAQDLAEDF